MCEGIQKGRGCGGVHRNASKKALCKVWFRFHRLFAFTIPKAEEGRIDKLQKKIKVPILEKYKEIL